MFYKRFARLLLVCVILLSFGMGVRTVYAGTSVDPSTLNPPVPPQFNPVCTATGFGTLCTVSFTQIEDPGGIGVFCGSGANSFEIMGSGDVGTVEGRRYYDQNNNLVERHYKEVFTGGTLYNPNTGASLNTFQSDTVVHKLTVPGDIASGDLHISGVNQFSLPKGGTVLVDTGTTILTAADELLVFESAHHPLDAFFSGDVSAIKPICDALMK